MDAKELDETIRTLEGYRVTLGALFSKVLAAYGGQAPSVQAVHEAQDAVSEAIGELYKLARKAPAKPAAPAT
jgi:hypothetical protein